VYPCLRDQDGKPRATGRRLGVSAGTIKDHVSSALRKLGVRTRAELAAAVSSHPGI
jgi:DNA-binding NarL/FixJ family response regulator